MVQFQRIHWTTGMTVAGPTQVCRVLQQLNALTQKRVRVPDVTTILENWSDNGQIQLTKVISIAETVEFPVDKSNYFLRPCDNV